MVPSTETEVRVRPPAEADAPAIWQLVRDSGVLDPNSAYCYMLLCRDFSGTCAVAEADGRVVGFVTGYRPPAEPDVLFVWQIGVDPAFRGRGVAHRLLGDVLTRDACTGVTHVETTITPGNRASKALFARLALRMGVSMTEVPGFGAELFPEPGHEPERRFRIGPFPVAGNPNPTNGPQEGGGRKTS